MVDILDEGATPSTSTINTLISSVLMGGVVGSTGVEKIVRD
tara:strand:+ start:10573 stop:10695 length:123 start_codon:yes stop_codon:yes gene_type:complete